MWIVLVAAPCFALEVGRDWREVSGAVGWANRYGHSSVELGDRIVVLGGYGSEAYTNDVWASQDGVSWIELTDQAAWSKRAEHASCVHDGYVYVAGGTRFTYGVHVFCGDVYRSSDGVDWVLVSGAGGAWSPRKAHQVVSFEGRLWLTGGVAGASTGALDDIWSSADGAAWVRADASAHWAGRQSHGMCVFDDRMWVIGGMNREEYYGDVWCSEDGIAWTRVTAEAPWGARARHAVVVYEGRIWVMGGSYGTHLYGDVWSSTNGEDWEQVVASAGWETRELASAVVWRGRMWVLGGRGIAGFPGLHDVWGALGIHYAGGQTGLGIQEAIDRAWPGEIVQVAPGIYDEPIEMRSELLVSGAGVSQTIIDVSGAAAHALVLRDVSDARVEGFFLTGGDATGEAEDARGGGVLCVNADDSNAIARCTIAGNRAVGSGGGICLENSSPRLTDLVIANNTSATGGGIAALGGGAAGLDNCIIAGNSASEGGGLYGEGPDSAFSLVNCLVTGNVATGAGAGMCVDNAAAEIANSTIAGNVAGSGGGGVHLVDGGGLTALNAILDANAPHAVFESDDVSDARTTSCLFNGSAVGDYWDEGLALFSGADEIDGNVFEATGSVEGDPRFVMDGAGAMGGNWTAPPMAVPGGRTILTDANAAWVMDELRGRLINPDVAQPLEALITSNTATAVTVVGDFTLVAALGDVYRIVDYRIEEGSAAQACGAVEGAPAVDFEGDERPGWDDAVDIGADEFALAPRVIAIRAADPVTTLTNGAQVVWLVEFDREVEGVDALGPGFDNFALTVVSGDQSATITAVSDSAGASIAVSAQTSPDREGTVRLDLVDVGAVRSRSNIPLVGGRVGDEMYRVDRVSPRIETFDIGPSGSDTSVIAAMVGFSELVDGFSSDDLAVRAEGMTFGSIGMDQVSSATYAVTVSGVSGNGTLALEVPEGAAFDGAGNGNRAAISASVTVRPPAPPACVSQRLWMLLE